MTTSPLEEPFWHPLCVVCGVGFLGQRVGRRRRCRSRAGKPGAECEAFHREAERVVGDARGWCSRVLAHHCAPEEDLGRCARCDCAAHVVRQERQPDLVRGCQRGVSCAALRMGRTGRVRVTYRSSSRILRGGPS